jgi:hypothetical protein
VYVRFAVAVSTSCPVRTMLLLLEPWTTMTVSASAIGDVLFVAGGSAMVKLFPVAVAFSAIVMASGAPS